MGRARRRLGLLEARLEAASRAQEPNAKGDRGDTKCPRSLGGCQVFPRDEEKCLAIEVRKPPERAVEGRVEFDGRLVEMLGLRSPGRGRDGATRLRENEIPRRSLEPR